MADQAKILLVGGGEVVVTDNPMNVSSRIAEALKNGERLTKFDSTDGDVYVAANLVAGIVRD